jgi:hypothetical protein
MRHDLRDEMFAAAERIEVPPGDVGAVTERGRQAIKRRRRGVVAVALVLVVVAAAAGGWSQLFGLERDIGREGNHGPAHQSEIGVRVEVESGGSFERNWRVVEWISANRELCTRVEVGGIRETVCGAGSLQSAGHDIQALQTLALRQGAGSVFFGRVGPEVAELSFEIDGRHPVQAALFPSGFPEYEGVSHFLAFVANDAGTAIAMDADGRTLAREDFKKTFVWGRAGGLREPRSD